MFKANKKMLALVLGVSILGLSLGFTGAAQGATNTLSVQFKNLKIYFNGQLAALGTQPLIVNGTTYLPVRALSTLFNKDIVWNGTTQTITIVDKADSNVEALKAQILVKDSQIKLLQDQLDQAKNPSLDDVETQLNKDYNDFNDMDWDIALSGDEDDIVMTLKINLDDYQSEWDDLSSTEIKNFLQDLADDIANDFPDANITGTIKDSGNNNKTLRTFKTSSSGAITVTSTAVSLSSLESTINDDWANDGDLGDIADINISLDGDSSDVVFTVEIDYSDTSNKDSWDSLSTSSIKTYMLNIQSDIEDAYTSADVSGKIVNTDTDLSMGKLSTSGTFTRYSASAFE